MLSILGQGGFGTVWRAKDTLLHRDVAVKVPRRDRMQWVNLALFLREARAAGTLRHPNIVAIHEVGEDESSAFIVSDYVDGYSLKALMKTSRMSYAQAAILVGKLAVAVHHAHEHGIVHRDLKPANVLMDHNGEPHIADFGLAKRAATDDSLAVPEQLVGTPAYMAPEQARADHNAIDRRTDVYALGVILYELLTGQTVFSGEPSYLLHQIQHDNPLPPRAINPGVPRDLEAICLKCLAKDQDKRYATAQALADDLHRFIGGETLQGIPAPIPYRVQKWLHRKRRLLLTMSALAIVVSGVTVFAISRFGPTAESTNLREVEFSTKPGECEITLVAIDPDTGEPDPTKIQHAKGLTKKKSEDPNGLSANASDGGGDPPLTMRLAPGDYLVVAVLKSEPSRFHEVYRHVPTIGEHPQAGVIQQDWELGKNNRDHVVITKFIQLPRPDITTEMGFTEATDRLTLPTSSGSSKPELWHVPAFYVDPAKPTLAAKRLPAGPETADAKPESGLMPGRLFGNRVGELERQGKRLPSAAELYYLSTVVCPPREPAVGDAVAESSEPPCTLSDGRQLHVLHSGIWEWTTTRPGGPFSGLAYSNLLPDLAVLRMVGCGTKLTTDDRSRAASATGFQWQSERSPELITGARGVRSAKPRRTPQDFVAPSTPTPVR